MKLEEPTIVVLQHLLAGLLGLDCACHFADLELSLFLSCVDDISGDSLRKAVYS